MSSEHAPPGGPREALEWAEYVVTAEIGPPVDTVAGVPVHTVSTVGLPVLKGDETGHLGLRVAVTPAPGPDGAPVDPLVGVRRAVLFLVRDERGGHWRTLVPGVLPVTDDGGSLPDHWPDHWPGHGDGQG
ncbi:hypothetical protein [Streptomyces sp. NBC_00690]|uniref:hypothetical protein n=1 Tax=Streptomyces sp. NBC_00690 TaxID=2975808 RepID=UPI002E2E0F87|nr:hypothetical protein [Streptomyces sp. NBC_00690]